MHTAPAGHYTRRIVRTICWVPTWNRARPGVGLEQVRLDDGAADGTILGFDDRGRPFELAYALRWDPGWRIRSAAFELVRAGGSRTLALASDGHGRWTRGDGTSLPALDGCLDVDLWPTPFTNTFPLRRAPFAIGERREIRVAWLDGLELTVTPQAQAYTRLAAQRYRFEALDGSGLEVELPVDEDAIVRDYPGLFQRVP